MTFDIKENEILNDVLLTIAKRKALDRARVQTSVFVAVFS